MNIYNQYIIYNPSCQSPPPSPHPSLAPLLIPSSPRLPRPPPSPPRVSSFRPPPALIALVCSMSRLVPTSVPATGALK